MTLARALAGSQSALDGTWVNVYQGTTWIGSATTNGSGVALLTLPAAGPYRFQASFWGRDFWSSTSDDCSPSSCLNTSIIVSGVEVTVAKADGDPVESTWVNAYGGPTWSTWIGNGLTNAQGKVRIGLPRDVAYKFQTAPWGQDFWTANSCAVADCGTASIQVAPAPTNVPVTVVRALTGTNLAIAGAWVNVYQGATWIGNGVTNSNGTATLSLPAGGTYRFHTQFWNGAFWSSAVDDCSASSCPNKTITVTGVEVTVLKPDNSPAPSAWVNAYSGDPTWSTWVLNGQTGADGVARIALHANVSYRFQTAFQGHDFLSNPCAVSSCGAVTIRVGNPVTVVRTMDVGPVPLGAAWVNVYQGSTWIGNGVTDANGVALVTLPGAGPYRFHTQFWNGQFFSSTSDDCTPTSCPNRTITVSGVEVTVVKPGYVPVASAWVNAFTGPSFSTWVANGQTGADGVARIALPAGASYKFQTAESGKHYWTGEGCSVAECSAAMIRLGDECFDVDDESNTTCVAADLCQEWLCRNHACTATEPVSVDDGDPCTLDRCEPATGAISHPPDLRPETEGVACEGSGPQPAKTCQMGVCRPNLEPYERAPRETEASQDPSVGSVPFYGTIKGEFNVTPSGAAVYTVPISIPPGIAGMAPNLSLVYNSQAGNSLAGQGWELAGLSAIHVCPKNRVQDGYPQAISTYQYTIDASSVCLDGKRLLMDSSGAYYTELDEFSTILDLGPEAGFRVITKSGEIRFYGSHPSSRVNHLAANQTVVWLLDRVMDPHENYYDVRYNEEDNEEHGHDHTSAGTRFEVDGIKVTSILYTGHNPGSQTRCAPGSTKTGCPFHTIKFDYDPPSSTDRQDVRSVRLGAAVIAKKKRLKSITTPLGTYTLSYEVDDPTHMLPSRLRRIDYCAGGECLPPLTFEWQGGHYGWEVADGSSPPPPPPPPGAPPPPPPPPGAPPPLPDYRLPARIDRPSAGKTRGTQLVDLNGDGRPEFVTETGEVWENRVQRFLVAPSWKLPVPLATPAPDSTPQARFADMDGDGLLDLVANPLPFTPSPGSPSGDQLPPPRVWLNRLYATSDTKWLPAQFPADFRAPDIWGSINLGNAARYMLVDMNGDGRADLVHFGTNSLVVDVVLNKSTGWVGHHPGLVYDLVSSGYPLNQGRFGLTSECTLIDVNRDGLADAVCKDATALNTGRANGTNGTVWGTPMDDTGLEPVPLGGRSFGDIDGDGIHDALTIHPLNSSQVCGRLCTQSYSEPHGRSAKASLGVSFIHAFSGHLAALQTFLPRLQGTVVDSGANITDPALYKTGRDHVFSFADFNADGLVDFVLNHSDGGQLLVNDGGQLLVNTGTTWADLHGATSRQESGGANAVPSVPADNIPDGYPGEPTLSTVYVDLDGDGVTDVARTLMSGSTLIRQSWLNKFKPPVIVKFPNGLATNTEVTYAVITTGSSYSDSGIRDNHTTFVRLPLRVVSQVKHEDGKGDGSASIQSYAYSDLRGSAMGRGPQGFKTVRVDDSASRISTTTTYLQAFPFTGMVKSVSRRVSVDHLDLDGPELTNTTTRYCYKAPGGAASCTLEDGSVTSVPEPLLGKSIFVYPYQVTDKSFFYGLFQRTGANPIQKTVTTTSEFSYDSRGNPLATSVTMDNETEKHTTATSYSYGPADSIHARMGKVLSTEVTTRRVLPSVSDPITHKTSFAYSQQNLIYVGGTHGETVVALDLTKKKVEEGAGWPIELHTAYAYDEFGNVTTTTSCQRDFARCDAGAPSPPSPSDPLNRDPSYRTVTTTYDPENLNAPAGFPRVPLTYGKGRFPVMVTNALGHAEYFAYDANKGAVVQQTGPNGIHTCRDFDSFGNATKETARCGSDQPLETTTARYRLSTGPYAVVAVTRPPSGSASPTWTYSDVLGRSSRTLTRAFNGGFIELGVTTYDSVGRVATQSKPRFDNGLGTPHQTSYGYDDAGRLSQIRQDLGNIDFEGPVNAQDTTTNTPGHLSITTTRTIKGVSLSRKETKNILGKVESVIDPYSIPISYAYDTDGNLTDVCRAGITCAPGAGTVHIEYDARGRKKRSVDADMGEWSYSYNGFGDLISQTDAKNQTTTLTYDQLGRVTNKTVGGATAEWVYDRAPHGVGKLAAMVSAPDSQLEGTCTVPYATVSGGSRAGRWFSYTAFGEEQDVSECTDGSTFVTSYEYDAFSRKQVLRYPAVNGTRLALRYKYTTTTGDLHYVSDDSNNKVFWAAITMNALGQVTRERTRNGVETESLLNPATGWLMASTSTALADGDTHIQDWKYEYDEAGNLRRRRRADDVNPGPSEETFGYDRLNRLEWSRVRVPTSGYDATESYSYDWFGNFITKNGKTYSYTGCMAGSRAAGPHAVCSVSGGGTFGYDGNGNMTSGAGRTITYNTDNKVTHISANGASVAFAYGADGNRVVQEVSGGGSTSRTVYVGLGGTGKSVYERTTEGGVTKHVHFLYAGGTRGGNAFALRVVTEDASHALSTATKYYHYDHLGSVTAMSDEIGRVANEAAGGADASVLGYDPWGARRKPDGKAPTTETFNQQIGRREFTGHETIPSVGLVNMNGRVYDPLIGRFLSADPNVQFVADLQSYNRYSYVLNNPLRNTDPTGYLSDETIGDIVVGAFFAAGAVACTLGTGGGCAWAVVAMSTFYTATAMANAGASFDQIAVTTIIGFGAGDFGGAVGKAALGSSIAGQVFGGAIAGAVSGVVTTAVYGGSLGENVARGAATGAVWAAFSATVSGGLLSLASAQAQESAQGEAQGGNANVGGGSDVGVTRGEIIAGEPITDPAVRREFLGAWKRSGSGGSAHEEGVTMERLSDGKWGRAQWWRESITLDQARRTQTVPTSDGQPLRPGKQYTDAHTHPWKAGTRLWKGAVTGAGPSDVDVAIHIGNLTRKIDVTSYVLSPEGIYRLGDSVRWIAPIDYLRTGGK